MGSLPAAVVQVFAAASLTDVLTALAPVYEAASGDALRFNFAGSNVLARQIQEGAPADVFFSADEARMDDLERAGLLLEGTRASLLTNTLVGVVVRDSPLSMDSARGFADPAIKRLALADPKGVPAGIYAKEYLQKIGLWEAVRERVVPTENVRAALAAVEAGNAEVGIVYKTDAGISRAVRIVFEVPAAEGPKISYPVAVVRDTWNAAAARRFVEFLKTDPARAVFEKFGFQVLR